MIHRHLIVGGILLLSIIILGCLPYKNCSTDVTCFKNAVSNCEPTRFNLVHDNSNLRFTLRGIDSDSCTVSLKVEELGQDIKNKYPIESKVLIGKTLTCKINANLPDKMKEISNIPETLDESCSGPVKDLLKGPLKEVVKEELTKILREKLG